MQLVCSKCSRILEFSGQRPSFCAYCGHPTSVIRGQTAGSSDPNAATINLAGDGSRAAASTPTTVGGYRLLRELGAGGMGTVFEAEEIASGRHVAVKLIASVFADPGDAVERFRQEGRIASMISHPRCVFVLAVEEEAGQPYIVMELMPGKTLKELVEERGPLPPGEAIAKILDVIDGLAEAHRLGFIHRDVKPSNCFLEADGRVKVGDFGLAKALTKDGHLTKTGAFVGTPYFAAPEQVRAEAVDQQADVYSV
ncbi:MAG TPA: serine/threonine-protein kinase, partial [Gemmataceae bacterium]|nr:serine/threonine-protein kinase [Gemmataceae bacterium]